MSLMFTTSWDDGHPLDLRLADLLARHGFKGTFYVPRTNREGRPVLDTAQLRQLAAGFEVGGHTLDHVRLDSLALEDARRQIGDGKLRLEDELGARVVGFCYPGGKHGRAIRRLVREAGFGYARTVENLCLDGSGDPYRLPTTLQFYPHRSTTLIKNFARGHRTARRGATLLAALRAGTFEQQLLVLLDRARRHGGMFHLWGHSWEIDAMQLWGALERFLEVARSLVPAASRVDNAGVVGPP